MRLAATYLATRADTWEEGPCVGLGKLGWDLTIRFSTISEQDEGRSDAESQPCRTRNVAGEQVEEVALARGGERSSGLDGCVAAERAE